MARSPRSSAFARVAAVALSFGAPVFPGGALAEEGPLKLTDRDYLEQRGLNVLVFSGEYNGMFFDEKTAGIEIIHHGVWTATGGAVRLKPTPEQWDQIPKVVERKVGRETSSIAVLLRYEGLDFDSRVVVRPEPRGFSVSVHLDRPLPAGLEGRLWGENEYVIDICARYILLANMVDELLRRNP
jgi:hypothetical protein